MKIKFFGAVGGEVTGSSYLIQTAKSNVMIDAGMFQGGRASEEKNKLQEGATPDKINALLLTHGHLDHTGRVPLLIKYGYDGPIYSTTETLALDSDHFARFGKITSSRCNAKKQKGLEEG